MIHLTTENEGHKHAVYLGPRGRGTMSPGPKNGHVHEIFFDELTQTWVIDEAEGHGHDFAEIPRSESRERRKKAQDRVSEVHTLFSEATGVERSSLQDGRDAWKFYMGDQWSSAGRAVLEANNRGVVTTNETQQLIDLITGHFRQNRTDITFKAVENSDDIDADIANALVKQVMDETDFRWEESEAFSDQVIPGRGHLEVFEDFDGNPEGDIKIKWFPWDRVRFGPHIRKDQSDLEYFVKFDNFSLAKLEQLYPDKARKIQRFIQNFDEADEPHQNIAGLAYRLNQQTSNVTLAGEVVIDVQRKEIKVFELWRKEFRRVKVITFPEDDFAESGEGMDSQTVAMFRQVPGIAIIDRNVHDIRKTVVAGNELLETEIVDFPENANEFHLFTAYAKKYRDRFQGKVWDVKEMQELVNKMHSLMVDAMLSMGGRGWFYDDDVFFDRGDEEHFREVSSSSGWMQKVKDLSRIPLKQDGTPFPAELAASLQLASNKLFQLMGVPPEAAGFGGAQASGKAILIKRRQSLVGLDFLFDNFSMMKKKIGRTILAHIQALYSPERVRRILRSQTISEEIDAATNVVGATDEQIVAFLENQDLDRFDIVVSESATTETMRDFAFLALAELAQQGVPIPPDEIIANSPLPNKRRILEKMGLMQQQQAQTEQATNQREIFKSLPEDLQRAMLQAQQAQGGGTNGQEVNTPGLGAVEAPGMQR